MHYGHLCICGSDALKCRLEGLWVGLVDWDVMVGWVIRWPGRPTDVHICRLVSGALWFSQRILKSVRGSFVAESRARGPMVQQHGPRT